MSLPETRRIGDVAKGEQVLHEASGLAPALDRAQVDPRCGGYGPTGLNGRLSQELEQWDETRGGSAPRRLVGEKLLDGSGDDARVQ